MLIGDFGGDQVMLHATPAGASIEFSCMEVIVKAPLTTDATGHFTASGGRRRTGGAVSIGADRPAKIFLCP